MIIQLKQRLKIKYLFLGISSMGLFGFVILPSWNRHRSEDKLINAQRQAEVLGYQAFEIYREAAENKAVAAQENSSRGPASVSPNIGPNLTPQESGSLGSDPWGQPYRYKILKASKDQLKVQIWSAGPNRKFETADLAGVAADSYSGDDVGIVLSMAHKAAE